MDAMMSSCAADTRWYLDDSRLSYHIVSKVGYETWLSTTSWQDHMMAHKCMLSTADLELATDGRLSHFCCLNWRPMCKKCGLFVQAELPFAIIFRVLTARIRGYQRPRDTI